jgi:hypothetical protein
MIYVLIILDNEHQHIICYIYGSANLGLQEELEAVWISWVPWACLDSGVGLSTGVRVDFRETG